MFSCCIYRVDLYIPCPPRVSQPGWGTCCWWDQVFHGYTYGKWPRNDTHTKRFSDAWIDMTWPGWAMSTPYYLYSQIYIWIPATPTLTHHSYSLPHLPTCLGFLRLEHIRAYVYPVSRGECRKRRSDMARRGGRGNLIQTVLFLDSPLFFWLYFLQGGMRRFCLHYYLYALAPLTFRCFWTPKKQKLNVKTK